MRSGSTLQYQLAAKLAESSKVGKRLGWVDADALTRQKKKFRRASKVYDRDV